MDNMWQLLSDLLFTSYFWTESILCQWVVLVHCPANVLKNPRAYQWQWGRTSVQVTATLQEQARQIHLQYRCTLLAVSLENLLLTKSPSNYFKQNSISLLVLPRKYEVIAFVDCFDMRGKSFCWKWLCDFTPVIQSKTWEGHRRNWRNHTPGVCIHIPTADVANMMAS